MAAENAVNFDDLATLEVGNDYENDGEEMLSFEPGDSVAGVIISVERDVGPNSNSIIHLARGGDLKDRVKFWSNGQINRVLEANGLGSGDALGVKKTEETRTYKNDDGEEQEYHVFDVRGL